MIDIPINRRALIWLLLLIIVLPMTFTFVSQKVLVSKLSDHAYIETIVAKLIKDNDTNMSFESTSGFFEGINLKLVLDKVKLEYPLAELKADKVAISFPITQLVTRRFRPASFDIDALEINYKVLQNNRAVRPKVLEEHSQPKEITEYVNEVLGNILAVPKIVLHGIKINYGYHISIENIIEIKNDFTSRLVPHMHNRGTIRLSLNRHKSGLMKSIRVSYHNINLRVREGDFSVSGNASFSTNAYQAIDRCLINLERMVGTLQVGGKREISNASGILLLTRSGLEVSKFSIMMDKKPISGAMTLDYNKNNIISRADIVVNSGSYLPLELIRTFSEEVPKEGYIKQAKIIIVNNTIQSGSVVFDDVTMLLRDMSFSEIKGDMKIKDDKWLFNITGGATKDGIVINLATIDAVRMPQKMWGVQAKAEATIHADRVVQYMRNIKFPFSDVVIQLITKESFDCNSIPITFMYDNKGEWKVMWEKVGVNNWKINSMTVARAVVHGYVADSGIDVVVHLNDTETARVQTKGEILEMNLPSHLVYAILPRVKEAISDFVNLSGNLDINVINQDGKHNITINLADATASIPLIRFANYHDGILSFGLRNSVLTDVRLDSKKTSAYINVIDYSSDKIALTDIKLNNRGNFSLEIIKGESANSVRITGTGIEYPAIDIDYLSTHQASNNRDMTFYVDVDKALLYNKVVLDRLKVVGCKPRIGDMSIEVGGFFENGEMVYYTRNDGIKLVTRNAGKLLAGLDITTAITDGTMRVDGVIRNGMEDITTEITGFKLSKTPIIARLLTFASLTGLLNVLNGSGIYFDTLHTSYTTNQKLIEIKELWAKGESIGVKMYGIINKGEIDLSGVLSTINVLDRAIQAIPFYGDLITGGEAGGVLGITFSIKGAIKDPIITVNPLSILTPGIMKRFFEKRHPTPMDVHGS